MDWSTVIPEFLKQGAGYTIAAVFGWFAWQLYKENRQNYKDQNAALRVDIDKMTTALGASTAAQNGTIEAMKQLKEVVETAVITKGGRR